MFRVPSEILKGTVGKICKSARKSGHGDKNLFIRTEKDGTVRFYYCGMDLSAEVGMKCEIHTDIETATTIHEMATKVSALPNETDVTVQLLNDSLLLKWGRDSVIKVDIITELSPPIEIPNFVQTVKWKPGSLHAITRNLIDFPLPANSTKSRDMPAALGLEFSKDPTNDKVYVRATDSYKAVTIRASKIGWFDNIKVSLDLKTLQGAGDVLAEDAEITVGVDTNACLIVFKAGLSTCVCRVLEGKFPDIDRNYNYNTEKHLLIDRLELIKLCKRVSILAPTNAIVQFIVEGDKVFAQIPSVFEEQLAATLEGKVSSFAIDAKNLEQCATLFQMLQGIKAEELTLYIPNPLGPVSIGYETNSEIRMMCACHRLSTTSRVSSGSKVKSSAKVESSV